MSNTLNSIGEKLYEGKEDIIIHLPEEFDMEVNLGYLKRNSNECMYEIENGTITKVLVIGETRSLVQIKVNDNNQMIVHCLGGTELSKPRQRAEVVRYIREWF
ncbi:MAG: DNA-3-methyladenine glycosylase, partial [Bacillus sp. (in: firmicutes)]